MGFAICDALPRMVNTIILKRQPAYIAAKNPGTPLAIKYGSASIIT
jgi:hypothetical protein